MMTQAETNSVTVPGLTPRPTPVASMTPHPKNYRNHPEDQLEHIIASIKQHGFYRNVVLARDGTILAGHGVVLAAKKMGLAELPAITLDVEPDSPRAMKILIGDNEISKLALVDDRMLTEALKQLDSDLDLLGTGFDKMMLAGLAFVTRTSDEIKDKEVAAQWAGMPEFDDGELDRFITVKFSSETDRAEFFKKLGLVQEECNITVKYQGRGMLMWYPPRPKNDVSSVEFQEGDGAAELPAELDDEEEAEDVA